MNDQIFRAALASLPPVFRDAHPYASLLLGSGWNRAVSSLRVLAEVPYGEISGFGAATVIGHDGRLLLVEGPRGGTALVFCGRRHWYEGCEWEQVVMPAVLAHRLGAPTLLVTNAAGGIRPTLRPGDVVILRDHLRLSPLTPLRGPHDPAFGPRFPDQSRVYDPALIELLRAGRKSENVKLKNPALCTLVFALSAVMLALDYFLVTRLTLNAATGALLTVYTIIGCIATLLLFWSLSGLLLRFFMSAKKLYFSELNSFTFRQISSKVNTTVFSMTIICFVGPVMQVFFFLSF